MRRELVTITVVLTGLGLAACGADEPDSTSAPPASAGSSTPQADGEGPPTSSCQGTFGDGEGAELRTVELKRLGDNLQVSYQLEEALPEGGDVLFTIDAWDLDGELGSQLGVEIDRRERVTQYVIVYPGETRTEVGGAEVELAQTSLVATYPLDMLTSLGEQFEWSATVKIGADPADSCPAVGPDPLEPERVGFTQ